MPRRWRTILKLNNKELWQECMGRLEADHHRLDRATVFEFVEIANPPNPAIRQQMVKDLLTYPIWDAAAMWVGSGGLVLYWPPIARIVKAILNGTGR